MVLDSCLNTPFHQAPVPQVSLCLDWQSSREGLERFSICRFERRLERPSQPSLTKPVVPAASHLTQISATPGPLAGLIDFDGAERRSHDSDEQPLRLLSPATD